jgi:hypothetical protein
MALLFIEGFDTMNSPSTDPANHTGLKWDFTQINVSTSNRFTGSGNCIADGSRGNFVARNIGQNLSAGVIGFAYNPGMSLSNLYKANMVVFMDGDLTSTVQFGLYIDNNRKLNLFRGDHSNTLGTTTYVLTQNQWHFIELKFAINNSISTGDVILYVNGSNVLQLANGTNTRATANNYVTGYRFNGAVPAFGSAGDSVWAIDDHYLLDLTGSTNNAPLGNCRVITLRPNGNGNSSQWVGSDGNSVNNYQQVDDPTGPFDFDSTYNESGNVGDKDTYSFDDLPATTNTVFGVQSNIFAKKTDTGTRTINHVTRIGGTDYDATATGDLTSGYLDYRTVMDVKPSDGTAWTVSDINNAEFGVKVNS